MQPEPQAIEYKPDPQIMPLAGWLGDPVSSAHFPEHILRFRNSRWENAIGLGHLTEEKWLDHFGRFAPLPDNIPQPLALRYHGHQFRNYNPDIGDGRGFLFAQMRDSAGRLLDLGTKGSGTTPYSRTADGRLTLKGGVREILATEMLEALGVNTSKTLSIIETGEQLQRGDEPSPTRSAVMVRLSHSHIRIGSFQRLSVLGEEEHLSALVDYCLTQFPGPPPPQDAPEREHPAILLIHQAAERLADLAASYMVAGFVHGVLNTDNMNITGESFDYGPWRFLGQWDPSFTAAYFDHSGLYSFGRQAEAIHWNLAQLAIALRPLVDAPPLIAAIDRFPALYHKAMARRFCWRLGVQSHGPEDDARLIETSEKMMREEKIGPDEFFFRYRSGRNASGLLGQALTGYKPSSSSALSNNYWNEEEPQSLLVDEVEAIWSAIAESDDWQPLETKIAAIRAMGNAHGKPPQPASHFGDAPP